MAATAYTVIGTTDEQDTCDCCGKRRLKMVVALRTDDGDVVKFGRSCAARATGWGPGNLGRKVAEADTELRRARYTVHNFGPFAAGYPGALEMFRRRNPNARNCRTDAEITAWSAAVVAKAQARLTAAGADAGTWEQGLQEINTRTGRYETADHWPL